MRVVGRMVLTAYRGMILPRVLSVGVSMAGGGRVLAGVRFIDDRVVMRRTMRDGESWRGNHREQRPYDRE